jgi:biotin operon repressor
LGKLSSALVGDTLFDGITYDAARDEVRLSRQLQNVKQILSDNRWHTLSEISQRIGGSEAGISARIRDLKKEKFGGHKIEKNHIANGLWRYRLSSDGIIR